MYDKLFTQKFMEDNDIFFENLKQISEPNKKQELFQNYIQSIENILAEKEGRNPAVVQAHLLIGDEKKNPSYDFVSNIMDVYYSPNNDPMEYILTVFHESEHTNQKHSPFKTEEQKQMYKISELLYISPKEGDNAIPYQYSSNYKEIEAKLSEMKLLLKIYKEAKSKHNILPLAYGKRFMRLFDEMKNYTKIIDKNTLQKLKLNNIQRTLMGNYFTDLHQISKLDMLKFLIVTAPKMYDKLQSEMDSVKKEVFAIQEELKDAYENNIQNTIVTLQEEENKIIQNREKEVEEMLKSPKFTFGIKELETTTDLDIEGIQNLRDTVAKFENDLSITEFYLISDVESDTYRIRYNLIEAEKNNFLDESEEINLETVVSSDNLSL